MKKMFACLLILALTLSAMPVFAVTSGVPVWDGSVAEGFDGGTGTASDPYQICDGAQLAYLAQQVNDGISYAEQYFILTADIRLNDTADLENWAKTAPANNWTPIGANWSWGFGGSLDGGNHTISGIYSVNEADSPTGLFGLMEQAAVKNLNIADGYITTQYNAGALAGMLSGTEVTNVTVSGCTVAVTEYDAGGLAGYAYESTVRNVTVTGGRISGSSFLAGILGEATDSTVIGCRAAVTVEGMYYDFAGICGYSCNTQLISCTSITQIFGVCEEEYSTVYEIGGITGYLDETSQILTCLNAGDISIQGDYCYEIGGIVGISYGTVQDCCNTGSISAVGNRESYEIGGIVGYLCDGSLQNTYNCGFMTVKADDAVNSIGGAVGIEYDASVQSTYYLDDCVSGDSTVGTALSGQQITRESSFPGFDLGWRWSMTSLGPVIESHSIVNGVCTDCGKPCGHLYILGICADCGMECPHTVMNEGTCIACGYRCSHSFTDGVCTVCGMVCGHIYQNGVCTLCNMSCDHQWDSALCLCSVCKMLCTHSVIENGLCTLCRAELSGNVWDGSVADGFDGGTGTKEDPYRIATGAQLAWFAQTVSDYTDGSAFDGQYVVLTQDIDLRNLPFETIGRSEGGYNHWFTGWFDGQGHTISGLNIVNYESRAVGLFATMARVSEGEAGVANLNVIGSVTSDSAYVGGIVGRMEGVTISGCSFTGQVIGGQFTGGISGQGERGYILNCRNYASVTGTARAAGINGGAEYFSAAIEGCVNYGNVYAEEYAAGIIARYHSESEYDDNGDIVGLRNPIVNCGNSGTITVMGSDNAYAEYAATGIAYGYSGQVDNCFNTGSLVALTDEFALYDLFNFDAVALNCRNSFYACNGNGIFGCGYVTDNAYADITPEAMQTQEFVDTLNSAAVANGWTQWKVGNTYPVFVTEAVEQIPAITGTALVLASVLRLKIHVTAAQPALRVTVGEDVQALTDYTTQDGAHTFELALPIHRLHESVSIELLTDGQVADTRVWTFEGYSEALRQEFEEDENMMTLLECLNDYGSYARYFADPVVNAPNASAVEAVTKAALQSYRYTFITDNAPDLQAATSLYLDDACDILVKFNASAFDGCTLYIDGTAVTPETIDGKAIYRISEILPQDWSTFCNIRAVNADGAVIFEIDYSVLSYAYSALSRQQEAQAGLNGLLKAMYLYAQAATNYQPA